MLVGIIFSSKCAELNYFFVLMNSIMS